MQKTVKNFFSLFLLSLLFLPLYAQAQKEIKGVVKDSNGEPLIGVTVGVKGTSKAILTDIDGKYTISVPASAKTLTATYVGMKENSQTITGPELNFVMEDVNSQLNEVVVIGYGAVKKKDLTGSVATVKGDAVAQIPVSNVAEALTGKLAGVQMTATDGSPDAQVIIRVRGGGSITQDNSPLYIVDGFPVNNINDISANDIQDISVLRDASSTAIYGARGANGVILITTKSAEGGRTRVNYNSFVQTRKISKRLDAMNTYDYVMSNYEYALLRGTSNVQSFIENFGVYDDLDLYKSVKPIDWQKDMFGANVLTQQQNVSITGGSKTTNFALSGTYDYNNGLMVNNNYRRYAFMFKLNHDIASNLRLGLNFRVSDQLVNGSGTQGGLYKIRTSQAVTAVATRGLSAFQDVDTSTMTDDQYQEYLQSTMTLSQQAQQYWKQTANRGFNFNASLDWTIVKGLIMHGEGGYGYGFNETKDWYGFTTTAASYVGGLPYADWTKYNKPTVREAVTLSYNFKVKKDNSFNVMIGQETSNNMSNYTYMYATKFSNAYTAEQVFDNFGLSSGVVDLQSVHEADTRLQSYFGRVNYSYKDRYLLAFTMRADGSSLFEKNKWGYFPGFSGAWRIMDESFMKSTQKWLSNLKLRLSYGDAGNNRINLVRPLYSVNPDSKRYGVGDVANDEYAMSSVLDNPKLKWETTTSRNIGVDFGFLNERISGTFDAYWNTTKDLIINHPITAPGYTSTYENSGQTSGHGVELSLNVNFVRKKNFTFDTNFNIGTNKTKVDKLANGLSYMYFQSGWASTDNKNVNDYIVQVGQPIGQMYGWVSDGYYKTEDFSSYDGSKYILKDGVPTTSLLGGAIGIRPGTMKLKDVSGPNGTPDGVVDSYDLQVIGHASPKCQGGFGFVTTFYGFDFAGNFTYTIGNDIFNANKIASSQQYRSGTYPNMLNFMRQDNSYSYMNPETGALLTSLDDLAYYNEGGNGGKAKQYWSPYSIGNSTIVPTSWAVENGSFLRLQSVTLGYTFPKKMINKLKVQNLRLYATATNLFVITGYSGYDPEVSSYVRNSSYSGLVPGVDYSSYPKSRGYTFGINVSF